MRFNKAGSALKLAVSGLARSKLAIDEVAGTAVLVVESGQRYRLRPLWLGEGWPEAVRQALSEFDGRVPPEVVVTSERFSPSAIELLRRWDANWADLAGNAHIAAPPALLVSRGTGSDSAEQAASLPRSIAWTPTAIALGEFLLAGGGRYFPPIEEIARRIGCTRQRISQLLKGFDREGWTVVGELARGRSSRTVFDFSGMLDSWASHLCDNRPRRKACTRETVDPLEFTLRELIPAMDARDHSWALSGWAASAVLSPALNAIPSVQLYVPTEVFESPHGLLTALDAEVGPGDGRIELWEADSALLSRAGHGTRSPLVSAPRLYADLMALGGRGIEAARSVREDHIGF